MKILAIEFSSAQRSVAVIEGTHASQLPPSPPLEAGAGERRATSENSQPVLSRAYEILETGERSTQTLGMIEEVLRQAQLEREQMDCLAIGLGPGSYAGIRSAIALAQGWELARPPGALGILGISSMEALAHQAQCEGVLGLLALVVDAQRNEFYLADYEITPETSRQTAPLRLASFDEVQQKQRLGSQLAGPDAPKWFAGSRDLFPHAAAVGHLALCRSDFVPAEKLQPIYLRETAFVKAPPPRPQL
jgi:tRNA threonylcarbamoyl adenosine modification protein YeaZ